MSGFRANLIVKKVGEALQRKLCLTNMSDELQEPQENGEEKLKFLAEQTESLLLHLEEINGALKQVRQRASEKQVKTETFLGMPIRVALRSRIMLQSISSFKIQIKSLKKVTV